MPRTLVIPDIHEEYERLEKLLSKHSDVDRRVFLGDWFDSFNPKSRHKQTAELLIKLADDPKNEFVWGNHDLQYSNIKNPHMFCAGYTDRKSRELAMVPWWVWKRFQLFWWETDNLLISHAGIHPSLAHPIKGVTREWLNEEGVRAKTALSSRCSHPLLDPGAVHGSKRQLYGGIFWLRWWELEPIEGIDQIVGHTPGDEVRWKKTKTSNNVCIDTHLRHVAYVDDGKITIHPA
jgi:calcineurin-like phosphoesterase family protein